MKTLVTGLFVLGLTIQSFAQTSSMAMNEVKLDNLVVSPSKNVSYSNSVASKKTSVKIEKLEAELGAFDITKSPVFKNNFETYQVIFKNSAGNIVATYDQDGKLLNAFEKFENIPLPESVRNAIKYEYPDYTIQSTVYRVKYYNDKIVKKVYNVQIINNNKKLNLKVSSEGEILNHLMK